MGRKHDLITVYGLLSMDLGVTLDEAVVERKRMARLTIPEIKTLLKSQRQAWDDWDARRLAAMAAELEGV